LNLFNPHTPTYRQNHTKQHHHQKHNKIKNTQAAQAKLGRMRRGHDAAGAARELELELAAVRKQLKCSVCCEREKCVVIKKCWHMFCRECVDRVIEARSRKCPGCGHKFSEADVQAVYLT
jgi:E3 ubiquitin-protein ligase BRE1